METKKKRWDVWALLSLLILAVYALFLLYPLFRLLIESVSKDGKLTGDYFAKFFSNGYYGTTLLHSFELSICATLVSLVLGVPLAYLYNLYEIKGRNLIQIIIILCCMSAPFIGAYAWVQLRGNNGIITQLIASIIGYRPPSIYGFRGIVIVLSLQLYPLVFMLVSGALKNVDSSLLEAAQNMGVGGARRFLKVVIPLCMPTILAAALLVFMRAFADYGTPLLIGRGYQTFPVIIYNEYFGETGTDHNFAAAVSVIAILITAVIFLFQKWASNRFAFNMNALHPIIRKKAKGIKNILIHAYTYVIVFLAFMPQLYVMYCSFRNTSGKIFAKGFGFMSYEKIARDLPLEIRNTFLIGLLALAAVVLLAILIAYLVVRRRSKLNDVIDTASMIPYIIPGSVVGIALVVAFNKQPLVLTGTMFIMIVALCIRRIPYTIRSSVAVLQQIPITVEEAAISLGCSKMKAFFKATVPMMRNGILSGAILSWVTIITELSTGVILYNRNTITLTLAIYAQVTRGSDGPAAALATILNVLTITSMLIFMKVSKNKDITF
ncbi:MAG: iron ABC transporter permease [Clostridia bacterium]|nr:iron ABC transporter permease [Clostridia bacterium]